MLQDLCATAALTAFGDEEAYEDVLPPLLRGRGFEFSEGGSERNRRVVQPYQYSAGPEFVGARRIHARPHHTLALELAYRPGCVLAAKKLTDFRVQALARLPGPRSRRGALYRERAAHARLALAFGQPGAGLAAGGAAQ
ncbi:hypothetical protein SY2F82_76790 [Streptomyces sp. Y2F8-2]|nr:hypothetical protein SY2F82_76790 [Streptomyces sp. Y2F8-2]